MSGGGNTRGGTLLLVGTGLVGGSFALAAKQRGVFERVVGIDRDPEALHQAFDLGIVDERGESLAASAAACDAACIAVPVGAVAGCVQEAAKALPLVFDVGSVKNPIVEALDPLPPNYVPCHPIAGSERAGPHAARRDLFDGATVVLTPIDGTNPAATETVRGYWQAIGAEVAIETPQEHDDRLALVSHLPHLVAFAFMEVAANTDSLAGVGGGFRDFTRIAAADAAIWTDILRASAPRVERHLEALIEALRRFSDAAQAPQDAAALQARIEAAAAARRAIDAAEH